MQGRGVRGAVAALKKELAERKAAKHSFYFQSRLHPGVSQESHSSGFRVTVADVGDGIARNLGSFGQDEHSAALTSGL
jgi:hypothetical protein